MTTEVSMSHPLQHPLHHYHSHINRHITGSPPSLSTPQTGLHETVVPITRSKDADCLGQVLSQSQSQNRRSVSDDPTPVDPTPYGSVQTSNGQCQNSSYADPQESKFSVKNEDLDERIKFRLTNQNLWGSFHKHTTEMIVTKAGRKMFPKFEFTIDGLDPKVWYGIFLTMVPKDQNRYKFQAGEWSAVGQADVRPPAMPVGHENGYLPGNQWMANPIGFDRIKLTNLPQTEQTNRYLISLASMHKYQPTISVYTIPPGMPTHYKLVATWAPSVTEFIAVTAYQNQNVTKLKIDNNPFAKGFREGSVRKRSHSISPDPDVKDPKRLALAGDLHKPIHPLAAAAQFQNWNNFAAFQAASLSGLYHPNLSQAMPQVQVPSSVASMASMVPTSINPYWSLYNPMLAAVTHPSMSMSVPPF